jgi:hypothetical protein
MLKGLSNKHKQPLMDWLGALGGSHTHPYPGLLHVKGTVK